MHLQLHTIALALVCFECPHCFRSSQMPYLPKQIRVGIALLSLRRGKKKTQIGSRPCVGRSFSCSLVKSGQSEQQECTDHSVGSVEPARSQKLLPRAGRFCSGELASWAFIKTTRPAQPFLAR